VNEYTHKPVLLSEVIEGLALKPDGTYLDATFGRGGHSLAILQQISSKGSLYVVDKDPEAILAAEALAATDKRLRVNMGSFATLGELVTRSDLAGNFDGILFDLGVSSPQLDQGERGFSFNKDGPLDMRMSKSGTTAESWLQSAKEQDISRVLKEYGEERFAKRIARAIVQTRQEAPLTSTLQLANLIRANVPNIEKNKHPATRSFQAIRIHINNELDEISQALNASLDLLRIGGRLLIITFHSLEDRLVKKFIQKEVKGDPYPRDLPVMNTSLCPTLKRIGKKVLPSEREINDNPRARSASLHIVEKIAAR